LGVLLAWTVGGCLVIFGLLELWRPCFFLTDDNLSSLLPIFTGMGRHMKSGHSPFFTEYLFGGNYDLSRDVGYPYWHPFYLLPALLSDTVARFWILDVSALLFFLLTTTGFTTLAYVLREEFDLKIPDIYLIFYTMSFVFSTFILMAGCSWINFLGNQSALPWLALGILDRKVLRGTVIVLLFTVHEILSAYAPLAISTALCLTLFAVGVALSRRSIQPLFCWFAANLAAPLLLAPFLLKIMDGFGHSVRVFGLPLDQLSINAIPVNVFPFSFFMGNWSEAVAIWNGDTHLTTLYFPYLTSLLACAAAWCVIPVLFDRSTPWRSLDRICLVTSGFLIISIIRPEWLAVTMYHLPFFRSMRWPFRESMQFLFFVHVLLILRFSERIPRWQPAFTLFSLMMFLLPLPFIHVPTFNPFFLDRRPLLGRCENAAQAHR